MEERILAGVLIVVSVVLTAIQINLYHRYDR
jgi:hypothetical protein